METEEWRDIAGYEEFYQISSVGWVRATVYRSGKRHAKGNLLKPYKSKRGYLMYILQRDGKAKGFTAHSLVARAFIGERPEGLTINHRDGNKENNHVDNLEYVTQKENSQHAADTGLLLPQKGTAHGMAKLTDEMVLEIRKRAANGEKQRELATEYKVSFQTISKIVRRLRWKHI